MTINREAAVKYLKQKYPGSEANIETWADNVEEEDSWRVFDYLEDTAEDFERYVDALS